MIENGQWNAYLTQWIGQQAIYDLRTRVYRHIQRQSLRFFDGQPIGRLITRATSDVESLSQVLSAGLVTILGDAFKIFFIAWFMFSLNWQLALVTISVMPIMNRMIRPRCLSAKLTRPFMRQGPLHSRRWRRP